MTPYPDPVSALSDAAIAYFVSRYLVGRYQNLDAFDGLKGDSLNEFVQDVLLFLPQHGADETRQRFFEPLRPSFDWLYGSVRPRRFDFDAQLLVPWLEGLRPGEVVLDFGAGDNSFLPAIATRVDRADLNYFACDFFAGNPYSSSRPSVAFLGQPSPTELPTLPSPNLVLLRRCAHHLNDLGCVLRNIRSRLARAGQVVLIEDTFDESGATVTCEMNGMVDEGLTEIFHRQLSREQKIRFLRFNDFYSNYVFHGWTSMPLPLAHTDMSGWTERLASAGFALMEGHNLGFPNATLNLHQVATGILRFVVS